MAELPRFQVVHTSEGRLRLRAAHPVPESVVLELGRRVTERSGVREVRASARTGSVLVLYDGELDPLLEHVRQLGLIHVVAPAPRTPMLRLEEALIETERRLAGKTRGLLSLGSLTFAAMAATGLWQTVQGRLLPAGITLFEYALEAIHREAERERAGVAKR